MDKICEQTGDTLKSVMASIYRGPGVEGVKYFAKYMVMWSLLNFHAFLMATEKLDAYAAKDELEKLYNSIITEQLMAHVQVKLDKGDL